MFGPIIVVKSDISDAYLLNAVQCGDSVVPVLIVARVFGFEDQGQLM